MPQHATTATLASTVARARPFAFPASPVKKEHHLASNVINAQMVTTLTNSNSQNARKQKVERLSWAAVPLLWKFPLVHSNNCVTTMVKHAWTLRNVLRDGTVSTQRIRFAKNAQ